MHSDDPQLHYETLESRARPARVAVLIDSSDIDWHHTALRIIEFLSSIWGGKHSVVVPTDGSTIEPVFWAILERFSPDYVYFYKKTWADIKVSSPEGYAAQLQKLIELYDRGGPVFEVEKIRIDSELQGAPASHFVLGTALCAEIAERLVPFHFESHFEWVIGNGYVPHQLTGILDVLPCVERPQSFASFEVPPEINTLWWTALTGAYSKALAEQLHSLSLNEGVIRASADALGGFVDWIARGAVNSEPGGINEILGDRPGFMPPDQTRPTPFDISMSCTGLYGSAISFRDLGDHFALVLGDSVADFCLSYCLPRIGHRAAWLPSAWIDALQSKRDTPLGNCVFSVVYAAPHNVRQGTGVKVCSVSKGIAYVSEALEILKQHAGIGLNGERVDPVEAMQVVATPAPTITPYCIDSPNHPEIYPFLGDRSAGAIRSPRPTGFSKLKASKHRWVAEVSARSRAVPTIPHIAEHLIVLPQPLGAFAVRVSHQALAYACPGFSLIIGDDINANLQSPEIGLFDTFAAVSFVAATKGSACQLSDKGIYQRDSFNKLGGVSKAAKLFKADGSRAVFEKFLDHTKRKQGTYDEGCVLDAEKRTYLDLTPIEKIMGGDPTAAVLLLDELTAAKVIYRGFALRCAVCKHAAWYSLADLTDEFRCTRCGRQQTISRQHWREPAAPQIFYKLDEIVYQFLKNDGDVVALSLDYMARKTRHPFNYSPEIEFRNADSALIGEIDFCAVYDGELTIGEAKRRGELAASDRESQKVIEKYVYLANMLNARRVLFCTISGEWKNSTVEAVHRAFQGRLAMPTFVAAEELLGKT